MTGAQMALLDHVPNGCLVVDVAGTVVFWNEVLEVWTGIRRAAITGLCLYDAFPHLAAPRYRSRIEQTLSLGAPTILSALLTKPFFPRTRDSERRRFEQVTVTRIFAASKSGPHALVTMTDVTEQHERGERFRQESRRASAEAEIRRAHAADLVIAKDLAESATRAKSFFLAAMSHELRTPMSGVLGMADVLLHSELTPWQREHIEVLQASASSLLVVLNDVLDFSKIEAGKLEIESIAFDPRSVVDESVILVAETAHAKDLECAAIVGPSVPRRVVGDPVRFRQVLVNLLSNAIKFTTQGEVVVRLEAVEEGDALVLRCAVSDTGAGMPQETCAKLFEPFTQAAAETSRLHGGTGLGLSISRRLVRLMGGDIRVASALAHGSVFSFEVRVLPAPAVSDGAKVVTRGRERRVAVALAHDASAASLCAQLESSGVEAAVVAPEDLAAETTREELSHIFVDAAALARSGLDPCTFRGAKIVLVTRPAASRGSPPEGIHALVSQPCRITNLEHVLGLTQARAPGAGATYEPLGLRVLVAEDDRTNQLIAARMLTSFGCVVQIVPDGQAAVEAASAEPYDIVLMDMQMPVMAGCEATEELRRRDYSGPILGATASALAEEQNACLQAGMNAVLTKPLDRRGLYDALVHWAASRMAA